MVNNILYENAMGSLLVSYWPSAPFWPVWAPKWNKFASFLKDRNIFPAGIIVMGNDFLEEVRD